MIRWIFSRSLPVRYVVLSVIVTIFLVYEMKELYEKFQRERRFTYYKSYLSEIQNYADKIEQSDNKSSNHTQRLSKLLQISLRKDGDNGDR